MFAPEDTRSAPYVSPASAPVVSAVQPAVQPAVEPAVDPMFDDFKNTVRKFASADKDVADLASKLRTARAEHAELKERICQFMEDRDIPSLQTREMRLKLKTSMVKPSLKKAELRDRVAEYLGGPERADEFFEKVYNDREAVTRTSLQKLKVR
jgi:hypothetical protein